MTFVEFLQTISSDLVGLRNESGSFYTTVIQRMKHYESLLKDLQQDELEQYLRDSNALSRPTKRVFLNLIKDIDSLCIKILQYQYKGNILYAAKLLQNLLICASYTKDRLNDWYANFLMSDIKNKGTYYRCVDFEKGKRPTNCNHVPFNLRYMVASGRFNQSGFPCLYLSGDKEILKRELGKPEEGKQRWCSLITNKKPLCLADLSIPSEKRINSMNSFETIAFASFYPLLILSYVKSDNKGYAFPEEYMFSQLFMHVLFLCKNDRMPKFHGIRYTSVHDRNCYNYIFPACYEGDEPQLKGHSKVIDELFSFSTPEEMQD